MLSTGGIRPIDAIRISHINFDFDNKQIVYLPAKKNRFGNDDNELSNHLVSVPLNNDNLSLFEKYKDCNANGFLFPCPCNIEEKGRYNYKRINQFEAYMNAVIKGIGKALNLDFVPTNYTMRKTAITYNACRVMRISLFGGLYAHLVIDKHHDPEKVERFIQECSGIEPNTK
jgi:hypothetical protein